MKNPIDAVAHIKHAGQYGCTHPGMAGRIRSRVMVRNLLAALLFMFGLLSCGGTERKTHSSQQPGMCAKEPMAADGIVRLSRIEVYPEFLDEYIKYATEVGYSTHEKDTVFIIRSNND